MLSLVRVTNITETPVARYIERNTKDDPFEHDFRITYVHEPLDPQDASITLEMKYLDLDPPGFCKRWTISKETWEHWKREAEAEEQAAAEAEAAEAAEEAEAAMKGLEISSAEDPKQPASE